jgi:hypothetical protein
MAEKAVQKQKNEKKSRLSIKECIFLYESWLPQRYIPKLSAYGYVRVSAVGS